MKRRKFYMKTIYDLLNDIDLDIDEYEKIELNDIEMKKLKDMVYDKIKRKNKYKKWQKSIASMVIISIIGIFLGKPILARSVNTLSGIIEKLNYDMKYKDLSDYTTTLNKTVTDKNVSITLTEILMDDNLLQIAYKIHYPNVKNDESKLSDIFLGLGVNINGEKLNAGRSGNTDFIDNDTVEVLQILNIANKKIPKKMDMKVYFKEMFGIAGNWEFKFKVSKEKIYKKTRNISINKYVELDNCKINVERIAISPISTTLIFKGHGEKKESILGLGFNIFDDRGKEIPTTTAGLSYDPEKNNKIEGVVNYNALSNKNIKNITIVPKYQNHNIKPNKSNPIDIKEKLPIILQQNEKNKLIIKDIEFKEDKIIVNYKAEGMSPINQSHRLYIYDENNKMLDEILEDRGKLLSNYYKTAIFTKVFKLNNSKKYYIGTDDMNDIKFYDKEKNIINIE
ncbi:DUF4179 domain-containing protein [Clostridium tetani]|nr:DUF4179 domain-containing protein [Clostridium tetani]RXI44343.1 DUF4179 domain-containing protein [Clostridium tetani]RXI52195.1 DUF4179 domain-containing protein [Clostridium tetani]RXI53965.1 DUF4179 domain-containing protein [Clostridium tetani]RXI70795.1 DUF4179 domain-containing protein [Clostridium tetani]